MAHDGYSGVNVHRGEPAHVAWQIPSVLVIDLSREVVEDTSTQPLI